MGDSCPSCSRLQPSAPTVYEVLYLRSTMHEPSSPPRLGCGKADPFGYVHVMVSQCVAAPPQLPSSHAHPVQATRMAGSDMQLPPKSKRLGGLSRARIPANPARGGHSPITARDPLHPRSFHYFMSRCRGLQLGPRENATTIISRGVLLLVRVVCGVLQRRGVLCLMTEPAPSGNETCFFYYYAPFLVLSSQSMLWNTMPCCRLETHN